MPYKPPHQCKTPGCRAVLTGKSRYCEEHEPVSRRTRDERYDKGCRKKDPALHRAQKIRSSAQWRNFRAWFVQLHPLCCDPLRRLLHGIKPVQQVHHILPLRSHPDLAYVEENCAPVCVMCHRSIEAMENQGTPTAGYFQPWDRVVGVDEHRISNPRG